MSCLDLAIQFVDLLAESDSQAMVDHEIIHEVVEDPVPQSSKGSDADNAPIIL